MTKTFRECDSDFEKKVPRQTVADDGGGESG
jgi:hypothetical protein